MFHSESPTCTRAARESYVTFCAGTVVDSVVQKENIDVTEETTVAKSVKWVLLLFKHYIGKMEDQ